MNDLESNMMGDPLKIFYDLNANKIHFELMVDDESYGNEVKDTEGGITRWYEGKISWEGPNDPEPYDIGAYKEVDSILRDILISMECEDRRMTRIEVKRLTSFIDSQDGEEGISSVNYSETTLMKYSQLER